MDNQQPKEDLRQKLRQAMNAKKAGRRKQKTVEELKKRIPLQSLSENQNIMAQSELLMMELETPHYKTMPLLEKVIELKDKYPFLSKKYPPIFRAIVHGEMNLNFLAMMLTHKDKITRGEKTQEGATQEMTNFLFDRFKKE